MKTSSIFWGTLFIVLGLLVLINNFSPINLDWGNLWQLWPVILVLFGISMLIKNKAGKGLITGAAAVILAIIIFTSIKISTDFVDNDFEIVLDDDGEYNFSETVYKEPFDSSISIAKLFLNGGAGSFNIGLTTDEMIYVKTIGVDNNFSFTTSKYDSVSKIKLNMKKTRFHLGKGKYKNKVDISLNEKPLWDLNFDLGAAAVNLDLSKYKLENIELNIGAASLDIKLGSLAEKTRLSIDAGASKIDISVPEEVGTQIKMDAVLSSKNIVGFKSLKSGLYRTEGFNEAEKKIFIEIDSGVSSINIRRYLE